MKKSSHQRILKELKSENPAIRRLALLKIKRQNIKSCFKILCNILSKDPSLVIRHEAAFILGSSKDKRALSPLVKAIRNDSSNLVRHEAIESLGDLGIRSKRIIELLEQLLKDKNVFIRDTAKIALATINMR